MPAGEFIEALERELQALRDEAQLEDTSPPKPYGITLGEHWLRHKVAAHTRETFHRADEQMVYLAIKDVLRELDRCRAGSG